MSDDKRLDPIVSETEAQAEAYDRWFRAKILAAIDNPGELIPHDEEMARVRETIRRTANKSA